MMIMKAMMMMMTTTAAAAVAAIATVVLMMVRPRISHHMGVWRTANTEIFAPSPRTKTSCGAKLPVLVETKHFGLVQVLWLRDFVWLRSHTEVYTKVKSLGPGGRCGFDV